jgi:hypothetical protein
METIISNVTDLIAAHATTPIANGKHFFFAGLSAKPTFSTAADRQRSGSVIKHNKIVAQPICRVSVGCKLQPDNHVELKRTHFHKVHLLCEGGRFRTTGKH